MIYRNSYLSVHLSLVFLFYRYRPFILIFFDPLAFDTSVYECEYMCVCVLARARALKYKQI